MRYFVVSDIHGFASELKASLKSAGFKKQNKDHILLILGDFCDRGSEAVEVYKFIKSVPKSRRILIRGNHESLFLDLLEKRYPCSYDFSNGTVDTFCQIANQDVYTASSGIMYKTADWLEDVHYCTEAESHEKCSIWEDIRNAVADSEIAKWLKSKEGKDYYELDKYIFVHSFIPTKLKEELINELGNYAYATENPENTEYDPNWRTSKTWYEATGGCPWKQYAVGLFKPEEAKGKTLVCGHGHTSDFYKRLKHIHIYDNSCAPIYYSKGLIGLDAGCQYSCLQESYYHHQNVLVIDEKFECYNEYGKKLVEPKKQKDIIIRTVTVDKDGNEIIGSDDFLEK